MRSIAVFTMEIEISSRRKTLTSNPNKILSLIILSVGSIALGVAGCNKTPDNSAQNQPAQADQPATDQSQDPAAAANLAPTSGNNTAPATTAQQPQNYSNSVPNSNYSAPAPSPNYSTDTDSDTGNYSEADYEESSYGQPV